MMNNVFIINILVIIIRTSIGHIIAHIIAGYSVWGE